MKLSDFDYYLPQHMIAQEPATVRDKSKLLIYEPTREVIQHSEFHEISNFLKDGDTLVLNDTRVVNARLFGNKPTGGKIELLVLEPFSEETASKKGNVYECLVKGKIRSGMDVDLKLKTDQRSPVIARILEQIEGGRYKVEFDSSANISELIETHGHVPLPPYIHKELQTPERYQTIYSRIDGSVAAPTAGLHFTPKLLERLKGVGINIAYITLHVSYGTFIPVRTEDVTQHKMDKEYAVLTSENAELINRAVASDTGRLVAVGTTTVRTLETIARQNTGKKELIKPWSGWSELFIYPGFKFKSGIDILITNFHLPKSTLLMLVSAFAGRENILRTYQEAIEHNYRFYSFGDAMMIIK
jgi:S-adenosylmethionine:tRNA ribosyltransferase-isomerase